MYNAVLAREMPASMAKKDEDDYHDKEEDGDDDDKELGPLLTVMGRRCWSRAAVAVAE